MLTGDETGWLLGDYILSQIDPGEVSESTVVASSLVSSRMLARIAAAHGARHVETLTGFKWLSRADADLPGCTLVYAYEEALGYMKGKRTRATGTWQLARRHGPMAAVKKRLDSRDGDTVAPTLKALGMQDYSFAAVLKTYPEAFDAMAA